MKFQCKMCGKQATVAGLVLYNLCKNCFEDFDNQKMRGRYEEWLHIDVLMDNRFYTEDVDEWICHKERYRN